MTGLPNSVEPHSHSRALTETPSPPTFHKNPSSRPGVWGRLVMESGALTFAWEKDDADISLAKGDTVVIPPETRHRVILNGPVSFFVEFYR